MLEDLKAKALEYIVVGEFLADLKKEFSGRDDEAIKVVKSKRIEQGSRMMEVFVQESS